ncbi:MAG TPA: creatininase family protein [Chloroflexi bacterium]|nr:creatininase family protein [Chloroflexota bacterium]
MQFEDLNWMDVESYLKQDDRVVLITGACEQHAYLSLLTDIRTPVAIARVACQREHVLIAPPLPYGVSPYFTAYPGTISLGAETFAAVVREVLAGLLRQGFRRVLVSNGHGGNTGVLRPLLIEFNTGRPGATLALFEWWRHPNVVAVAEEAGLAQYHANWSESFPFTRVGEVPEGEKAPPDLPRIAPAEAFREALGDGSFGGAYTAPEAVSERLFDAAVEAMVAALQEL